jgi:hypothetical protein
MYTKDSFFLFPYLLLMYFNHPPPLDKNAGGGRRKSARNGKSSRSCIYDDVEGEACEKIYFDTVDNDAYTHARYQDNEKTVDMEAAAAAR